MGTDADSLAATLRRAAESAAQNLGCPVFFEGGPYVPPACVHLRFGLELASAKSAGCGTHAPSRIDGRMKFTAVSLAPDMAGARGLAARLQGQFPRGLGLDCDGPLGSGEIVIGAPSTVAPASGQGRCRVEVAIPFYAIIFPQVTK